MNVAPLFLHLCNCTKKIIVAQGGGDAAKTVSILQRMAIKRINKRNTIGTVTGATVPHVKAGALRSFQMYVANDPQIEKYINQYNATDRTYKFYNGSILEFKSYQDELGARGSERHDLFMNECNAETYETFWQLQRKTREQVFLDYNPTSPFWVHVKLLPWSKDQERQFFNKVQFYRVDHRHNPFLTAEEHLAYETISDPDMFRVYSRGLTGKIKGLIFGHFKEWTEAWPADVLRTIWGIDYGYTNDPTVLLRIAVGGDGKPRRRIGKELCYEPGLTAEHIKNLLVTNGVKASDMIYSEADPNMINQLRQLGMPVYPAIKGPGSLAAGISKVREHECYYIGEKFKQEIMSYKWLTAQDITTGKEVMTNVPVDEWNHACDAFRMADYTDSFKHR